MPVHDPRELSLSSQVQTWLNDWLRANPKRLSHVLIGLSSPGYRHQLDFEAYLLGLIQGGTLHDWEAPWIKLDPWMYYHHPNLLPDLYGSPEKIFTAPSSQGDYNIASVRYWYCPGDSVETKTYFLPMPIFDSYSVDLFIKGLAIRDRLPPTHLRLGLLQMGILSQGFSEDQIRRTEALLVDRKARFSLHMLTGQRWEDVPYPLSKIGVGKSGSYFYERILDGPNVAASTRLALTKKMPHYSAGQFTSTISAEVVLDKLRGVSRKVLNLGWLQRLSHRPALLDDPNVVVPALPLVSDPTWQKVIPSLVVRSDLAAKLRQCAPTSIMALPRILRLGQEQ